jgi:hypothetical protein
MPNEPTIPAGPLAPQRYIEHLRAVIRPKRNAKTINALRDACDAWTIADPRVDPCEPLVDDACATIELPRGEWNSICFELLVALRRTVMEGDALYINPKRMTHDVAAYIGAIHLELAAREDPPMGTNEHAVLLPLLVAARTGTNADAFRRYLIDWYDRAGAQDWNHDALSPSLGTNLSHTVALAIALGPSVDPHVGESIAQVRGWLDRGSTNLACFEDIADADDRPLWRDIAASSAPDAQAWTQGFMR